MKKNMSTQQSESQNANILSLRFTSGKDVHSPSEIEIIISIINKNKLKLRISRRSGSPF